MSIKDKIKDITFFSHLNNIQFSDLLEISNINKYTENSILYYESDNNPNILFLLSGLIKIYKVDKFDNEIFLYHIQKNSIISELSSLDEKNIYSFSNAEIVEESEVLSINYERFKNIFLSDIKLTSKLINTILEKTHLLQYVLNRELVFDASAKVAYMLSNDLEIVNKLKRQEISFMLHIQPETLSRVLKKLIRNNIISIESSKIKVINKDDLNSMFRGIGL